jgi:HSP20 family molecular chaperone IbpA
MAKEIVRNDKSGTPEITRTGRELTPPVDIYENDQELLLVADLPGVQADGLEVKLDPPSLRIEGRPAHDGGDARLTREFRITEAIDPDGISAELRNGVLKVHLKKSQALRPRKVEVRAN